MTEEYLGDGLYASYVRGQFVLRAPRHDGQDHRVYLEPEVLGNFMIFVERVTKGEACAPDNRLG